MQLTVRAISKLFKVPEKTVYRWIEQDDLPSSLIDGHYGFNRGELVEWATARHIPVPDELFQTTDSNVAALPTLTEALRAGGIFHRLKGTDKESVLRATVAAMPLPQDVDRHLLLQMLLARETLQSTGVGEGIAIPHAQHPLPGSADVCFITSLPLDDCMAHVRAQGVQIIEGPVDKTGATSKLRSFYFRDPDQNLIEVSNRVAAVAP